MRSVDQIEDAVQLLWRQSPKAWAEYLLSAFPLILVGLGFVRDMTSGYETDRCLLESLLVACVFLWSAYWKARFAGTLLRSTTASDASPSRSRFRQCLFIAGALETLKLIALPLAALSIVPLAWTSRFFRVAHIESDQPACTLANVVRRSAKLASAASAGNWFSLLLLFVMGLVVFINVLFGAALLPSLAKIFTGYENEWTRNPRAVVNFSFLTAVFAATWFIMNPLVEACAVVGYFYAEAQSDGRDLLIQLRRLAVASGILILLAATPISAFQNHDRQGAASTLSPGDLTRAIRQTSTNPEFRRQIATYQKHSPSGFADRIAQDLDRLSTQVQSWFSAFGEWLRKLLRQSSNPAADEVPSKQSLPHLQAVLYAVAVSLALAIVFAFVRRRKTPALLDELAAAPSPAAPDLAADNLLPSDLSDAEWLRLAREYVAKGEPRLAIRAMYLSNLAHLGARQMITIATSKTNGIYERELRMRAGENEAFRAFFSSNRDYERAWYGLHDVTAELTESFEDNAQAIRNHV